MVLRFFNQVLDSILDQFVQYLKQRGCTGGIICLVGGLMGSTQAMAHLQECLDKDFGADKFVGVKSFKTKVYESVAQGCIPLAHLDQYEGKGFDVQHIAVISGVSFNMRLGLVFERSQAEFERALFSKVSSVKDVKARFRELRSTVFNGIRERAEKYNGAGGMIGSQLYVRPNTEYGFNVYLVQYPVSATIESLTDADMNTSSKGVVRARIEVHLKDFFYKNHPACVLPTQTQ